MSAPAEARVRFSLIDRLTAPMRRIQSRIDRMLAPMRRVGAAFTRLSTASGIDRLGSRLGTLASKLGNAARYAGALAVSLGAVMAFGAGAGIGQIVSVNAELEKFGTVLETVLGSREAAQTSLDWISDFAAKTPYELNEVTGSFVKLTSYGIDPMNGSLVAAGDAGAAMGKTIDQAVEALADAMTGENERLKEFGIRARAEGDKLVYTWTENGKQMAAAADKNSRKQIEAVITGIWNRRYSGAMDKLSGTWGGMTSNLSDQWARFLLRIGESGAFEHLKSRLESFLGTLDEWAATGKLGAIASQISDGLVAAMVALEDAVTKIDWAELWTGLQDGFAVLSQGAEMFMQISDLFGGPVVTGALLLVGVITGPLIAALASLAASAVAVGVAFLSTPIGWIIAGIAAVAAGVYLLIENWDAVVAAWESGWASVSAWASGVGAAVVEWFTVDLAGIASNVVAGYLTALQAGWGPVLSWGVSLAAEVASWFGIDLYAVGEAIVQTLLAGLQSAWAGVTQWLSDSIAGITNIMPDWVKEGLGIPVVAKVLTEEEMASKAKEAGQRAADAAAPADMLWDSDEEKQRRAVARSAAFKAAEADELARLRAENERLKAPDMSAPSAIPSAPLETQTVDAGAVNATTFNVPEPIVAHQPQNVDASMSVNMTVNVASGDSREVRAAVKAALAEHAALQRSNIISALND